MAIKSKSSISRDILSVVRGKPQGKADVHHVQSVRFPDTTGPAAVSVEIDGPAKPPVSVFCFASVTTVCLEALV